MPRARLSASTTGDEIAPVLPGKRARRPQAERTSETRAKVLNSAAACLHLFGYGGTTISMVAARAGVSRGAITHQFANKVDLMLAVVRMEFEEDVEFYGRLFAERSVSETIADMPRTLWQRLSRPAAIAVTEIMLASRSDNELAEKLHVVQSKMDEQARAGIRRHFASAGITLRDDDDAMHRLFLAAIRGLAIESLFNRNPAAIEASVEMLHRMLVSFYPQLEQTSEIAGVTSRSGKG